MDKVDCMQQQMNKVSRKKEILSKNQKEMLEVKNTVAEMKSAFMTEERVFALQGIWIEASKTEKESK